MTLGASNNKTHDYVWLKKSSSVSFLSLSYLGPEPVTMSHRIYPSGLVRPLYLVPNSPSWASSCDVPVRGSPDFSPGTSCHASPTESQTAQTFSRPLWLTKRRERFRHSNLGLQSKVFHERSHCAWPLSSAGGSRVTANTHSSLSAASAGSPGPCKVTVPLLRALPVLEEPGSEAKAHTPQPGSGVFLLTTWDWQPAHFLLYSFEVLRIAEHGCPDAVPTNHTTPMRELWLECMGPTSGVYSHCSHVNLSQSRRIFQKTVG